MKVADESAVGNGNNHILQDDKVRIDISMLYEISDSDKNFIMTMVRTFLKNMPVTLNNLDQGLIHKDWENVYKAAHSAKSSLSVLKIDQMLKLIVRVEGNAFNKINLDEVQGQVDNIKQLYFAAEKLLIENCLEG